MMNLILWLAGWILLGIVVVAGACFYVIAMLAFIDMLAGDDNDDKEDTKDV